MKKLEFISRIALFLIVLLGAVAIILQIINEKTDAIETVYEIITFSVSMMALAIALYASLESAKNTRELNQMARKMQASLRELSEINSEGDELRRELHDDLTLDRKELQKLSTFLEKYQK